MDKRNYLWLGVGAVAIVFFAAVVAPTSVNTDFSKNLLAQSKTYTPKALPVAGTIVNTSNTPSSVPQSIKPEDLTFVHGPDSYAHERTSDTHQFGSIMHSSASAFHTEGSAAPSHDKYSTTHTRISLTHRSGSDTHTSNTTNHDGPSITHYISSDGHRDDSDRHNEDSWYHRVGSLIHNQYSHEHIKNSALHFIGTDVHSSDSTRHNVGSTFVSPPAETADSLASENSERPSAPSSFSGLKLGSSGPDVFALQDLLVKQNLLTVEPTGYFGSQTQRALMLLQKRYSLTETGYVDQFTSILLNTLK